MLWVGDRPIDVEVVDYVLFLEPPTLCRSHFSINTNGQDAIIVEMVKVFGLSVGHDDLREELDHPPTCI